MWDGQHGTTDRAAFRHLTRGDHAISVRYLYDSLPAANFQISWEGPGIPLQPIPREALRVQDRGDIPRPTVQTSAPGDGTGHILIDVRPQGHKITRTALYLGTLQLAASDGPTVRYDGPLPQGNNTLWARIRYDGDHNINQTIDQTIDTDPVTLTVNGRPISADWTVRNVGDKHASAGLWQTSVNSSVNSSSNSLPDL